MKKELVESLWVKVRDVARIFSNPERALNYSKELFTIDKIVPLSESVALALFVKMPSNKKALAVFVYINGGEGYWQYFFPTYDQLTGLSRVDKYLHDVEIYNFDKNGV